MKKILPALPFICLLSVDSLAGQAIPRFEDYPSPAYRGRRAPVNLRGAKRARMFRTVLREGANEGVNFAGHFTLVSWGCGTTCTISAIVDQRNGTVFFPRQLDGWYGYIGENWGVNSDEDIHQYRVNSRLLRMIGSPDATGDRETLPGTYGIYYYEWTGSRLRLVRFIRKSDPPK